MWRWLLAGLLPFAFCTFNCSADLAVTGTPGFTFSDTAAGRPTVANLNRALQFTYSIQGTVGGTNAGLAAESVTGTMLTDTVAGTNLIWDIGSPRSLQIMDGGVGPYQINTSIAGQGLSGGSGTNLNVNIGSGLAITNDTVTVTNVLPGALTVTSNSVVLGSTNHVGRAVTLPQFATNLAVAGFVSFDYTLVDGGIINTNHGLNISPGLVRAVLVCQTNDAGYVVGDELSADSVHHATSGTAAFAVGGSSTNVFLSSYNSAVSFAVYDKSTGAETAIVKARWKGRVYARP